MKLFVLQEVLGIPDMIGSVNVVNLLGTVHVPRKVLRKVSVSCGELRYDHHRPAERVGEDINKTRLINSLMIYS